MSNFRSQRVRLLPKSHQVYKYDLVHPLFNDYISRRLSLVSADRQIHAHADIYTRRREQGMAHKAGRQSFGSAVSEIRIGQRDVA